MKIAIVPGSFDPVTNGHLDIIFAAAELFDRVLAVVTVNAEKKTLFTREERIALLQEAVTGRENIEVVSCGGLLARYAQEAGACAIVKGARGASDFDYEMQLAAVNQEQTGIRTVILPSSKEVSYISSTVARQIAQFHGDLTHLVPPCVERALIDKFEKEGL